jgi:hypothetical protein
MGFGTTYFGALRSWRFPATIFLLALVGCQPKPDKAIVLWEQPAPAIAALAHAREIGGIAFVVAPTGSMEPLITGGDWVVADSRIPYEKLKVGDIVIYQARWLPPMSQLVMHMAAAKLGDEWIMDGIANSHYEREKSERMGRAEYRGKVVQVYTKRAKS